MLGALCERGTLPPPLPAPIHLPFLRGTFRYSVIIEKFKVTGRAHCKNRTWPKILSFAALFLSLTLPYARACARQFPGKISTTGERNGIKKYRAAMFIRSGTAFFWDRARPRDAFHIGDLETKISEKCRSL